MTIESKSTQAVICSLFLITVLTPFGCKSAGGEGAGQNGTSISQPLTMLPEYQARAPRKCASVKKPPSAAEAAVLVQCTMDGLSDTGLGLTQNVQLEMGTPREFVYWTDAGLAGIDLKAQVYPLRGSYDSYFCRLIGNMVPVGQSCIKNTVAEATGWCWKASFGDWKCKMQGAPVMTKVGAPQTF